MGLPTNFQDILARLYSGAPGSLNDASSRMLIGRRQQPPSDIVMPGASAEAALPKDTTSGLPANNQGGLISDIKNAKDAYGLGKDIFGSKPAVFGATPTGSLSFEAMPEGASLLTGATTAAAPSIGSMLMKFLGF